MLAGARHVDPDTIEDDVGWSGEPGQLLHALYGGKFIVDGDRLCEWYDEAASDWLALQEKRQRRRRLSAARSARYRKRKGVTHKERDVTQERSDVTQEKSVRHAPVTQNRSDVTVHDIHTYKQTDIQTDLLPGAPVRANSNMPGWVVAVESEYEGDLATRVRRCVERVSEAQGWMADPYTVWMVARPILRSASSQKHFAFALDALLDKISTGEAKVHGSAPWKWLRTVAGNGPMRSRREDVDWSHINTRQRQVVDEVEEGGSVYLVYDDNSREFMGTREEYEAMKCQDEEAAAW